MSISALMLLVTQHPLHELIEWCSLWLWWCKCKPPAAGYWS